LLFERLKLRIVAGRERRKESDPPDPPRLLSERTERRAQRTRAECNEKFAATIHSITVVA